MPALTSPISLTLKASVSANDFITLFYLYLEENPSAVDLDHLTKSSVVACVNSYLVRHGLNSIKTKLTPQNALKRASVASALRGIVQLDDATKL
jgi:hypothetical protein